MRTWGPGSRARIESPKATGQETNALVRCTRCGYLLGGLEFEIVRDGHGASALEYRRTVFTEEIVPRPARHIATGLPAFGPRNRVRLGRGNSARRREPGRRGDAHWSSVTRPAFVYCPERDCGVGQVVDPADLQASAPLPHVPLR